MPGARFSGSVATGVAVVACGSAPAAAHAFGARYDLPLPMWFYLVGAGAAVALSFLVMALFLRPGGSGPADWRLELSAVPGLRLLTARSVIALLQLVSVTLFVLVLATALVGVDEPFGNFASIFVWVVWWVGLAFVSALGGDLWRLVNPWSVLFGWAQALRGRAIGPLFDYPPHLGRWPAAALFLVFAWLELVSTLGERPRALAWLILAYSALTWAGMALFGRTLWRDRAEAFSVVFGLLARFAPTAGGDGRWWLRPPAVGLLTTRPVGGGTLAVVLLVLTTVTFDGLLETPAWRDLLDWIAASGSLRPALLWLRGLGFDLLVVIETLALLLLPLAFLAALLLVSAAMAWSAGSSGRRLASWTVARWFILSLVPIAIAYHLSHYLSYLLIAGQHVIPLASDPFGWGWDLFGTAGYDIDLGIVDARAIWITSVAAIVIGHVYAVYLAHVTAFRAFGERRAALRSQVPMTVLMVGYTMLSLWILAQPIVE